MGSICHDISASINKTCVDGKSVSLGGDKSCNWTLPSSEIALKIFNASVMVKGTGREYNPSGFYNLTSVRSAQVLTFTNESRQSIATNMENWDTLAAECALPPCVQTYNISVTQGFIAKTLLSETIVKKVSERPYAPFVATSMHCLMIGTEYPVAPLQQDSTLNVTVWDLLPDNRTSYFPKDCYFLYGNSLGLQ